MGNGKSRSSGSSLSSSRAERRSQMDMQDRVCERQRALLSHRGRVKLHAGAYNVRAESSPAAQSEMQSISSSVGSAHGV